jgi:hypothetical protein
MAYVATTANNTWEVPRYGDPSNTLIDGLAGVDRLSFERLPRSRFLITQDNEGIIHVDSVSGASSTYHLRLKNVEFLLFNGNRDVVDLEAMFKDIKAPEINSFNFHTTGFSAAVDANLELGFNENVSRGSGAIVLSTESGTVVERFAAGSSQVSLNGRTLSINPSANLAYGSTYTVTLEASAVADTSANGMLQRSLTFNTVANQAPVAANAQVTVQEDKTVSGNVPAATDKEGQTLSYALQAGPAHGTVTLGADGRYVYTPQQEYSGDDSFTYVASDGLANSPAARISIQVTPVMDAIAGTSGDDTLTGNGDGDRFTGGGGNDIFSGGGGIDIASYAASASSFRISKSGSNWLIEDTLGTQGRDTLVSVERAVFADQGIAFDLDGNAGMAAKLLGAIAGKAAVQNKLYMGTVLDLLDKGMSPTDVASMAINVVRGGDTSARGIVSLIYQNLAGTAPDEGTLTQFAGMLDRGELSAGQLGVMAAEHALNTAAIDLVGLAQTGVGYALV